MSDADDEDVIGDALREIAIDWKATREENKLMRAAFQEMVDQYTADPSKGFTIKHVRCSYCGEAWPRLEGATYEALQAQTIAHAEVCLKNEIRIERDHLRKENSYLGAEVSRLRRALGDGK